MQDTTRLRLQLKRLAQKRLVEFVRGNCIVVYGTSATKDCASSLRELLPACLQLYLVQAKHSRAMPIDRLIEAANSIPQHAPKVRVTGRGSIEHTIRDIFKRGEADTLIVCGSFYLMEEAFSAIGLKIPFRSEDISVNRP